MDSHISSFQISTFIASLSVSETPDYTEANIVVKHTSKTENFSFVCFQFLKKQICILYIRPRSVK